MCSFQMMIIMMVERVVDCTWCCLFWPQNCILTRRESVRKMEKLSKMWNGTECRKIVFKISFCVFIIKIQRGAVKKIHDLYCLSTASTHTHKSWKKEQVEVKLISSPFQFERVPFSLYTLFFKHVTKYTRKVRVSEHPTTEMNNHGRLHLAKGTLFSIYSFRVWWGMTTFCDFSLSLALWIPYEIMLTIMKSKAHFLLLLG